MNGVLHSGGEFERGVLFEDDRDWAYTTIHIRQERSVVTEIIE